MLTLKAPIQLHIAQPRSAETDAFGERIRGNYSLLGAHFTPKDLLFFMTAPPELPEELGGMTTLVSQNQQTDVRSISVDVVNNVVNRILLDGTQQFTYQDQVYVTTVLNRLGITNVSQFMEQVRRLRVENESTVQLTRLYRDEITRLLQRRARGERVPAVPLKREEDAAEPEKTPEPRTVLAMQILSRLDTARIYETVHAFQRQWSGESAVFRSQELRLSEQLRFSNQMTLAEMKQTFYSQPSLSLRHHVNIYEAGAELEPPKNEEQVLSQAAAAALLSAVDSTVIQTLNRPEYRSQQWVQVQNDRWQTAENSVSRFETYHTQTLALLPRETESREAWYHYAQELLEYQTLSRTLEPEREEDATPRPSAAARMETLRTLRETILQKLQPHALPRAGEERGAERTLTVLRREHEELETERLRETTLRTDRTAERTHTEQTRLEHLTTLQEPSASERPAGTDGTPERARPVPPPPPPERMELTMPPPPPMAADEAEEQAPEKLVKELERIDRHNRTILQTLQEQSRGPVPVSPARPDLDRTMRSALRALEEPETVLQELREARQRHSRESAPAPLTHREAALLEQAQPQERALYEAVLAYQRDPETALTQGLVRPAGQAALQAAIHTLAAETPVALEHPAPDAPDRTETLAEQLSPALERMVRAAGARRTVIEEQTIPSAVRIVHKRAAPDVTEELLEQLTEQHKSELRRTESREQTTVRQEHQVDVKQVERNVTVQTSEDITELVNRTLARQMRTISDQVYRQMEKRLQTERSRRGRL